MEFDTVALYTQPRVKAARVVVALLMRQHQDSRFGHVERRHLEAGLEMLETTQSHLRESGWTGLVDEGDLLVSQTLFAEHSGAEVHALSRLIVHLQRLNSGQAVGDHPIYELRNFFQRLADRALARGL